MIMLKPDFEIGGGWGDHIDWMTVDWDSINMNKDILHVYGHLPFNRPKVGQTLLGHFEHSDILFKFLTVEYKSDPPDMFFATVKAVHQVMKE